MLSGPHLFFGRQFLSNFSRGRSVSDQVYGVKVLRRGSRVNGDGFMKQRVPSRGVQGHAPLGNVLDFFFIPTVPFPGLLINSEKSE